MRKTMIVLVALALFAGLVMTAEAQNPDKRKELNRAGNPPYGRAAINGPVFSRVAPRFASGGRGGALGDKVDGPFTGTVQYDSGTINALPTGFGLIFGNRFDRTSGGSAFSGSLIQLNSFSFYFLEDSTADTGLFLQPAEPVGGGSFLARASASIVGLVNSGPSFSAPVLNVIPQPALGTSGQFAADTFYLGAWSLNDATTFPVDNETIGLDTNGSQGYTAASGVGVIAFNNQLFNAVLRANITTNVVPVELMSFEVD